MIGQQKLILDFSAKLRYKEFPQFVLLVGAIGSGRKTLLKEVLPGDRSLWYTDVSVSNMRSVVEKSYKVKDSFFVICDVDNMSVQARNALLKVVEECPNGNRYIMTVTSVSKVLETIKSRSQVFYMDLYLVTQLEEYVRSIKPNIDDAELELITDIASTPGDANYLLDVGVKQFYSFVELVYNHIQTVSLANAFKMPNKVAVKNGAEGYDLRMFWQTFLAICEKHLLAGDLLDAQSISITSKYLRKLDVRGVNRQMLVDNWILDMRAE